MELTNVDLVNISGFPLSKVKRFTRLFLGNDPAHPAGGGTARTFSILSGFGILLGGFLVHALRFRQNEAVEIVRALGPWLDGKGLRPISPERERDGNEEYNVRIYEREDGDFALIGEVIYGERLNEKGQTVRTYKEEAIYSPDGKYPWHSTGAYGYFDGSFYTARVLPVTELYDAFMIYTTRKASGFFDKSQKRRKRG